MANAETLSTAEFQILLALGSGEAHGYAIMQEVERRFAGQRAVLGPGTLYGAIRRLRERRLIAEREDPADTRRRTYELTQAGEEVARAEARRHAELVKWARETGLAPGEAT